MERPYHQLSNLVERLDARAIQVEGYDPYAEDVSGAHRQRSLPQLSSARIQSRSQRLSVYRHTLLCAPDSIDSSEALAALLRVRVTV